VRTEEWRATARKIDRPRYRSDQYRLLHRSSSWMAQQLDGLYHDVCIVITLTQEYGITAIAIFSAVLSAIGGITGASKPDDTACGATSTRVQ